MQAASAAGRVAHQPPSVGLSVVTLNLHKPHSIRFGGDRLALDVLPPGPRLPVAVQTAAWAIRPWDFMERCAARYGDTFTMRLVGERPWVLISHPEAVKEVFTGPPGLLHAGEASRFLLPVVGANSVLLLDEDAHREQRRLLMPPFRGNHLASYADTITAVAKAEIARWRAASRCACTRGCGR